MDVVKLFENYSVPIAGENEKHYRAGWVNTSCPFCTGNPGNHLGYNVQNDYFFCWRCGPKQTEKVLISLLGIDYKKAKEIIREYAGKSKKNNKVLTVKKKNFLRPAGNLITQNNLPSVYLWKRGFSVIDIKKIQNHFDLYYTGSLYSLDNLDLSYRIIAPIYYKNKMVSWQSRDVTGKASLRYITCPENRELIKHKHILYNDHPDLKEVVLCEGIFDVWKVFLAGFNAVCGFGVELTYEQIYRLIQYKKLVLFLDPDKAGQKHADVLYKRLLFSGVNCEIAVNPTKKDPGDMEIKRIKEILTPYF